VTTTEVLPADDNPVHPATRRFSRRVLGPGSWGLIALATATLAAQQQPVFRARRDAVSVDVIIRDRTGAVVAA
jgi:hypothetical protein